MSEQASPLLAARDIEISLAGLKVLKGVSFDVLEGEILALIGPNGAGKTTMFNILSGLMSPSGGSIRFKDEDITRQKPNQRCRSGLARTFQIPRPFGEATVVQNLEIARMYGLAGSEGRDPLSLDDVIDFTSLNKVRKSPAHSLTLSELRRLELARALATNPSLLLLDETFSGLTSSETQESLDLTQRLRRDLDMTILWIEHVMSAVMATADRIVVIAYGEKLMVGSPSEVASDPRVIEVYLGEPRRAPRDSHE